MVRVLKILAAVVGLLVALLGGLMAYTFAGLAANTAEAWPGVGFSILDGYVSIGVLELGDGTVALIDAGNDAEGKALIAGLEAHGHKLSDVTAVLLTHGHSDHTSGLALLPNARVFAMIEEKPYVEGKQAFDGPLPSLMGAEAHGRVTHAVTDGAKITLGQRQLQGFLVPGHTHGSAAWLVDGVLFLGDTASLTSSGDLVGAPWIFSDDQAENGASIAALAKRVADLPVTRLVTSHSGGVAGVGALAAFRP